MNSKHILPILLIFPALFMIVTAQPILMVSASDDDNNQQLTNIPGGQGTQGQGIAVGEPDPTANQDDDDDQEPIPTEPNQGPGTTPPGQGFPAVPSGRNLAESNQIGGIGSGNIQQNAQGAVNEQYCSTIAGIGDRRCQQSATPGAQNIQDCDAIAGLGQAACVQSEAGGGTGTCLTANGRPYICYTDTGVAISGSGQAQAGGP